MKRRAPTAESDTELDRWGTAESAPGERFTISALAERSGTRIPTIHHYRRIGLLPPAEELASNRFLYNERHVDALVVIQLLRERRSLPLEAIREVLPELMDLNREGTMAADGWEKLILSHLERSGPGAISTRLIVAARTLFSERGYAAVNVADICKSAKIAKGSFYRYFDSKEAIFLAVARSTVDAVGDQLDKIPARMNERQAVEKLQSLMRPMAPILLEVTTGELLHQPALVGVMGIIATGLAARLMPRLITRGAGAMPAARRVVEVAVSGLVRPALQSSR